MEFHEPIICIDIHTRTMSNSILIPVRDSEEVVRVERDQLPDDVTDIIDILKAELAPLSIWLEFAIEYYKQGKVKQFQEILEEASAPSIYFIILEMVNKIS